MFKRKHINQSGQAVLIVLLSLSVVLIIVLFIMSRSITDISLSTKEEDSSRAFSAAEAGIERALIIGSSIGTTDLGGGTFNANVSSFGSGESQVVYPLSLKSGESAVFWYSRNGDPLSYSGSSVEFCWGDKNTSSNDTQTPALEVLTYYIDSGVYKVSRSTFDPYSNRTITSNNFSSATSGTCTLQSEEFQFYSTANVPNGSGIQLLYSVAKLLYNTSNSHKVGIDVGVPTLPSQGNQIEADGSYGDANRSIQVFQLHPVAPPVFDNVLFSTSGIIK